MMFYIIIEDQLSNILIITMIPTFMYLVFNGVYVKVLNILMFITFLLKNILGYKALLYMTTYKRRKEK